MKYNTTATVDRVRDLLRYDPVTGEFWWRESRGRVSAGSKAGSFRRGYLVIRVDGICYAAHRLAFVIMTGRWPAKGIDHKDGGYSNVWLNLREAGQGENQANKGKQKNHKSGRVGVSRDTRSGKWMAVLNINRKRHWLGYFDNFDDAVVARETAEREHHGVFSRWSK